MKQTVKQFLKELPRFLKYQIMTKLLFGILILPIFTSLSQWLIKRRGVEALSNDDLLIFLFSSSGLIFVIISLILILIMTVVELFGFIVLSTSVIEKKEESSYNQLLGFNFNQIHRLFDIGLPLIIIYLVFLLPITGNGIVLEHLSSFKVPPFIMSVIESNGLYLGIYVLIISVLGLISFYMIFTFHYIVLKRLKPVEAIKQSFRLVSKHFYTLIKEILKMGMIFGLSIVFIVMLWIGGIYLISESINFNNQSGKFVLFFLLLLQYVGLELGRMIFVPFEMYHLTELFYRFETVETLHLPLKRMSRFNIKPHRILSVLGLLLILGLSYLLSNETQNTFDQTTIPKVIGHRGGLGNENSISAIKHSINLGIDAIEIDIQRTSDNHYVLNHDSNLKRLFNSSQSVQQMTLEELLTLSFSDGEKIASLNDVLDLTKDKLDLYIELKGVTADSKMVEDVIELAKSNNMLNQVVLISLDYELINYIVSHHPEVKAGFIYFLSFGNPSTFNGNVLIMEEDAANQMKVGEIQLANKEAIVWTVNDEESMIRIVNLSVNGIITDKAQELVDFLDQHINKSAKERLLEKFILIDE